MVVKLANLSKNLKVSVHFSPAVLHNWLKRVVNTLKNQVEWHCLCGSLHTSHKWQDKENTTRLLLLTFSMICFNSNNKACHTTELESVNIGEIFSKRTERLVVSTTGCNVKSSLSPVKESWWKLALWWLSWDKSSYIKDNVAKSSYN